MLQASLESIHRTCSLLRTRSVAPSHAPLLARTLRTRPIDPATVRVPRSCTHCRPEHHQLLPPGSVLRSTTPYRRPLHTSPPKMSSNGSSAQSPSSSRAPALRLQSTRIALVQMGQMSKDKEANIRHAREMITKAAKEGPGADMVVLPECWNSPYGVQYFNDYAEDFGGLWERVKRPIDRRGGSRSRARDDDEEDVNDDEDDDDGNDGRGDGRQADGHAAVARQGRQGAPRAAGKGNDEADLLQRWGIDGLGGAALEVDTATCPSESLKFMSSMARELGIVLVGGSVPERHGRDGKLFNTATVFDQKGRLIAIHRKVHLFDINIPGKMTFQESLTLTGGDRVTIFECSLGRFGLGICYDMRFPELAAIAGRLGAGAMIYPAAFNTTTGPRHWELLQRCRAMDNQMYVIACSPARASEEDIKAGAYPAWGHSTITDPWATVVATTEEHEDVVRWTLEPGVVEEVRTGIPITRQRRYDVYTDPASS